MICEDLKGRKVLVTGAGSGIGTAEDVAQAVLFLASEAEALSPASISPAMVSYT